MNKIVVFGFLLVSTIFLGGCSLYGGTKGNSSNVNTNPTTRQEPAIGSTSIIIQNFAFTPETLTVKKGSAVTWTNKDSAPHQIKSDSFNSTQLTNGQSFSFTFDTSGTFNYSCTIHPSMVGKIIVE